MPGGHPLPVLLDVRRVHDGHVAIRLEPIHREVVHDAALVPAHGGVEDAPGVELQNVVRHHFVKKGARPRAARLELAHVAHVEQAGRPPHRVVLVHHARVLDGHLEARERRHLRAGGPVPLIQGGSAQLPRLARHERPPLAVKFRLRMSLTPFRGEFQGVFKAKPRECAPTARGVERTPESEFRNHPLHDKQRPVRELYRDR